MSLKKEHLSIYLAFKLKARFKNGDPETIEEFDYTTSEVCGVHTNRCALDEVKPLFRRLSQITKPITHNGETFIPAERLAAKGYKFAKYDPKIGYGYKKIGQKPGENIGYLNLDVTKWPYEYFIQLVEMHFDVFSKIDSGDASVKK